MCTFAIEIVFLPLEMQFCFKKWVRVRLQNFFMLNSAEHQIYPAKNFKMPTIVGILTFLSMINSTFEGLKAGSFVILVFMSR